MKVLCLAALSLLAGLSLVCANPPPASGAAKITKNEAEHIALKFHKDARVTSAKLGENEGRKIWAIEIAQGEHRSIVQVDATSGRVVPALATGR